MDKYFYSKTENGFFINYETAPIDAVEISLEVWSSLLKGQEKGMVITGDTNGHPILINALPITQGNMKILNQTKKETLIISANSYMNERQWAGKAALGRLKDDDLVLYNLWLDYLDALEAVDTTSTSDIHWPTQPASLAS